MAVNCSMQATCGCLCCVVVLLCMLCCETVRVAKERPRHYSSTTVLIHLGIASSDPYAKGILERLCEPQDMNERERESQQLFHELLT